MRRMGVWAAVACLAVGSPARAGDGEQLAPDQLPPEVANGIRKFFGAEPLHAGREVDGGKACYTVSVMEKGHVIEIYASPDGKVFVPKTEAFSLARWADKLVGSALILLPGVVAGAVARAVVRAARDGTLSVPAGWLSAWGGAGIGMGLVVFNIATSPREKDVLVLGAYCVLWGAIAASAVEVVVLAVQPGQRGRVARRRWVIGCCGVAAVSLALLIPLDILCIERQNHHFKKLTLRPAAG